jgi:hypothetical protein
MTKEKPLGQMWGKHKNFLGDFYDMLLHNSQNQVSFLYIKNSTVHMFNTTRGPGFSITSQK